MIKAKLNIISGLTDLIESFEKANIMFSNKIKFIIDNTLLFIKSWRNLLFQRYTT